MNWFATDIQGIKKLVEVRGKTMVLIELLQHAWASNAKCVEITMHPLPDNPALTYIKVVTDDPLGFSELARAFTTFIEEGKTGKMFRRGTVNLGEKFLLEICSNMKIGAVTGTYAFTKEAATQCFENPKEGSYFEGVVKQPQGNTLDIVAKLKTLLPPHNVKTIINKGVLAERMPLFVFEDALPTEITEVAGSLKKGIRTTMVRVFKPNPGETAHLYELGIPIVEIEGAWHIDVCQKLQTNFTRDEVTAPYLKMVHIMVQKHARKKLGRK